MSALGVSKEKENKPIPQEPAVQNMPWATSEWAYALLHGTAVGDTLSHLREKLKYVDIEAVCVFQYLDRRNGVYIYWDILIPI